MINVSFTEEEAAALSQMLQERRDQAAAVANTAHGLLQRIATAAQPEPASSPDAMRG